MLVDGISATSFGLAVERLSFVYGYHAFFGCVSNCPCLHRFGGLHVKFRHRQYYAAAICRADQLGCQAFCTFDRNGESPAINAIRTTGRSSCLGWSGS